MIERDERILANTNHMQLYIFILLEIEKFNNII
jgi:hypothetical protein